MTWTNREIYVRTMMEVAKDFPDGAYMGFLTVEKGIDVEEIVEVSKKLEQDRERERTMPNDNRCGMSGCEKPLHEPHSHPEATKPIRRRERTMSRKCHVCGEGPADGVTLIRQNPLGQTPAVWACRRCDAKGLDGETDRLVRVLEGEGHE